LQLAEIDVVAQPLLWRHNDLQVYYYPELDGGGTILADSFVTFVTELAPGKKYNKIFEWGCGPGFIGFALLAEGMCQRLCLSDINPVAIECVRRTIAENDLQDQVSCYVSDNFNSIPLDERFDLVVTNPPNFFAINPKHFLYDSFKDDLRPNDPGWQIHKSFYANVGKYLNRGALLCVSEVEPFKSRVCIPRSEPEPWDIRPGSPLEDFKSMIQAGGLTYLDAVHYTTMEGGVEMWMLISCAS
jgi:hypothetical protein